MACKNENLHLDTIKNDVIQYLYKWKIPVKLQHHEIQASDLQILANNKYVICPRSRGTRSWIIFANIANKYYAVSFPKHAMHKRDALRIYAIDLAVPKEMYAGTIMEGIYYIHNSEKTLVIDQVYYFCGQDQRIKTKADSLHDLREYLQLKIQNTNLYNLYVTTFYNTDQASLNELYEKIKRDNMQFLQELTFYPQSYGTGNIYYYSLVPSDLIDDVIEKATFIMRTTCNADVYHLLHTASRNRIDIAYIPDITTSKKCSSWFRAKKITELLVECQFCANKNKWIPVKIITDA